MLSFFNGHKIETPAKEWIDALATAQTHSPDISELQQYKAQLLFVVDSLQRGGERHQLLEDGPMFWGTYFTRNRFSAWEKRPDRTAVVLEDKYVRTHQARLKGELYCVRPSRFLTIDNAMRNGYGEEHPFFRKRVKVDVLTYSRGERVIVGNDAWMYVGNPTYWTRRIDDGYSYPTLPLKRSKQDFIGEYYHFETS